MFFLVPPCSADEQDGEDDDDDEAGGVFLPCDGIMPDDGLDARGGEFSDEGGNHVVPKAHGAQCTYGIEEHRGDVWNHACDEHDGEAVFAAVFVDIGKGFVLGDDFFCCFPKEEAQKEETDGDTDGLSDAGEDNAGDNAEDEGIGRGEDDGRREAERIHEQREPEAEKNSPSAEGFNIFCSFQDIPMGKHAPKARKKFGIQNMNGKKEKQDQDACNQLDGAHGVQFHRCPLLKTYKKL